MFSWKTEIKYSKKKIDPEKKYYMAYVLFQVSTSPKITKIISNALKLHRF